MAATTLEIASEAAARTLDTPSAAGTALELADQRAVARVKPTLTHADLADLVEFGEVVARSKFFADMQSTAQAVVKLSIGRELGLSKTASLTGIFIFTTKDGTKVVISGQLLVAKINADPRYRLEILRSDTHACYIHPWKRGGLFGAGAEGEEFQRLTPACREAGCVGGRRGDDWCANCYGTGYVPVKFTIEDAKRLELLSKNNWKGDPESMLLWRCAAKTQRRYFGDVLAIGQAYVEGELEEVDLPRALTAAGAPAPQVTVLKPRRASEAPPANAVDAVTTPVAGPQPCDGNHGAPICGDPQCWHTPTDPPLDIEVGPECFGGDEYRAEPPRRDEIEICQGGEVINTRCNECSDAVAARKTKPTGGEKTCPKGHGAFTGLFCPECMK